MKRFNIKDVNLQEIIQDQNSASKDIRKWVLENYENESKVLQDKIYQKLYGKFYRTNNKEYFDKKSKEWAAENKEKLKNYRREFMRSYYHENREVLLERVKKYRAKILKNPVTKRKYLEYQKNRRLVQKGKSDVS